MAGTSASLGTRTLATTYLQYASARLSHARLASDPPSSPAHLARLFDDDPDQVEAGEAKKTPVVRFGAGDGSGKGIEVLAGYLNWKKTLRVMGTRSKRFPPARTPVIGRM